MTISRKTTEQCVWCPGIVSVFGRYCLRWLSEYTKRTRQSHHRLSWVRPLSFARKARHLWDSTPDVLIWMDEARSTWHEPPVLEQQHEVVAEVLLYCFVSNVGNYPPHLSVSLYPGHSSSGERRPPHEHYYDRALRTARNSRRTRVASGRGGPQSSVQIVTWTVWYNKYAWSRRYWAASGMGLSSFHTGDHAEPCCPSHRNTYACHTHVWFFAWCASSVFGPLHSTRSSLGHQYRAQILHKLPTKCVWKTMRSKSPIMRVFGVVPGLGNSLRVVEIRIDCCAFTYGPPLFLDHRFAQISQSFLLRRRAVVPTKRRSTCWGTPSCR